MKLDIMDLCTPELQKKLTPMRERIKEVEDKKAASAKVSKADAIVQRVIEGRNNQAAKEPAKAQKDIKYEPYDFPDGKDRCNLYDKHHQPHPQIKEATTVDTTI